MSSNVFYKVQVSYDLFNWEDFSEEFSNLIDAENFAFEWSRRSYFYAARVVRVEISVCNEYF